jgi:hypothetical protein
MTESGHAASFGIDIIIMASAGGVELAVGAAAVERHDGVCAEGGVIPQQGALAYDPQNANSLRDNRIAWFLASSNRVQLVLQGKVGQKLSDVVLNQQRQQPAVITQSEPDQTSGIQNPASPTARGHLARLRCATLGRRPHEQITHQPALGHT